MKKCIKYPSIEQFRSIVATINRQASFVGLDENGDAIYDGLKPKPVLTFVGTVKGHGTNAGVSFNDIDGIWYQSRENIITPTSDNAGFAFYAETNKDTFLRFFDIIKFRESLDLTTNTVTIYGEFAGGNIQKGVGLTNIPKSFFIFGVKITPHTSSEEEEKNNPAYWVDSFGLINHAVRIYDIYDFKTYTIDIDFNHPELSQNTLIDMTIEVENECPIAKAFGFDNTIGEGIVFTTIFNGNPLRFKSKGLKHSSSRVKTIASVDVEKVASIREFVDYAVTESRFNQGIENTFPNNEPVDIKKLGALMKWITDDVTKEEMDTMKANNLEPKDVNKYISTKVREMFMKLPV